jgi:hypothetical protein
MHIRAAWFVFLTSLYGSILMAQEAEIVVHADRVSHRVSPYTIGACIEDVNHEIYGGIYSQMIFGESFEEPPWSPPPAGFQVYGGNWVVRNRTLNVAPGPGPKLIADVPELSVGEVGVELFFEDDSLGNAGLIVKVSEPGVGADTFIGYEVSLSPRDQKVILGRHRHNWEPIKSVSCEVPVNKWIPLVVTMDETQLEVLVGAKSVLRYKDETHPLRSGRIGLRPWQRKALYRNLWVKREGQHDALPFKPPGGEGCRGEVSGMWRPLARGSAQGEFALESEGTFNGLQSQRITFLSGEGDVGIENQSLNRWGMYFQSGKPYEGYVWVKADKTTSFAVAVESADGSRVYAERELRTDQGGWNKTEFTLTPSGTDKNGRFAMKLKRPSSIVAGHAFLQPGPWGRFKGLPVRRDIAQGLIEQGLTVLRLGGSMINATEYRWKKMIGPRDRRPPYRGTWYPYSSNGWGIVDFLDFCEAAGFLGIPAFNIEETPEDMADFVEYVNGDPQAEWGKKRSEDGHPEPYSLKYIEIGNEEAINEYYFQRFKLLAEAIWNKDPDVIPVIGDFLYNARIRDPFDFDGAPAIRSLAAHKKILEFAAGRGKTVWFDVHVGNHDPRQPDEPSGGIIGLRDFIGSLQSFNTGADFKVCVFEENAHNHAVRRALGHAHAVNELQRLSHEMPVVCAANCLQPYKQNDNGWDQGMLFFTPSRVWGQPPYYVTQMISRNALPLCVHADFKSSNNDLDVTAHMNEHATTLTLQVVNLDAQRLETRIHLVSFTPKNPVARVTQIAGEIDDVNTPDDPEKIVPWERRWRYAIENGEVTYTFPPCSFSVLRFE